MMIKGTRTAGLLVPLFSIPSTRSWGIGELGDLAPFAAWLREAGMGALQVLPLNEMAAGSQSPYFVMSAMAIDPILISVGQLEDFNALGGVAAMGSEWRGHLAAATSAASIRYGLVRHVKEAALRASFDHFRAADLDRGTPRAERFRAWCGAEAWWLDDYALFRALHAREAERSWIDWAPPLRDREPRAIEAARMELAGEVRFRQYAQWVAGEQWQAARRAAGEISILGDLPFMVGADSADVWVRQGQFRLDASVGAPPDAFSETGQRWGLPPYRWDAAARTGFEWLALRARRLAGLFDGYRIDHVVGFYRTYVIPDGRVFGEFSPSEPAAQLALGETVVRVLTSANGRIVAEDLGIVPDFVRDSLTRLGIPGYRVLRWEREWHADGRPYRNPGEYPRLSVATSGTHDTETLGAWWDSLDERERATLARVPGLVRLLPGALSFTNAPFSAAVRDALLELLYASGSDLLILPVQDVFGWRDRINLPGQVSDDNWTWRLPWWSDELGAQAEAAERASTLRAWADRYGRLKTAHPLTDL